MAKKKVAVVTGANKGIGFQVVKILCSRFDGDVVLCSRDEERGQEAVSKLNESGLKPIFFKLDIGNKDDIRRLEKKLQCEYDGIDLLINNAAILSVPKGSDRASEENIQAQVGVVKTNYFDTAAVSDTLLPIVKKGGRVINVSSSAGMIKFLKNEQIANKLISDDLTREELDQIANQYIDDLKNGRDEANGWPLKSYAYFASKILLTALTWIQQKQMSPRDVAVFAVHPGYVQTDMTRKMGDLTPEEGAASIIFAALEAKPGDEFKRRIVFPPNEPREWLSEDVFQNGMSVDHILGFMDEWMAKLAEA